MYLNQEAKENEAFFNNLLEATNIDDEMNYDE